jgi:fructose/tagatose bisphosphate aldolase
VKEQIKAQDDKPVFLVFHGGSGSSVDDFRQAISYGVVKVNLDTDMQWAYLSGVRDYVLNKKDYLMTQVGNPEGSGKPNKKCKFCLYELYVKHILTSYLCADYDPRVCKSLISAYRLSFSY